MLPLYQISQTMTTFYCKTKFVITIALLLTFKLIIAQNTSYTPLYTSSTFTKTINLTRPVGEVGGSANVQGSGGSGYSIPIFTPPGTNGLEPTISLMYSSLSGAGVAGYGWNISGLSVISRSGKNVYNDGIVKPTAYTASDAFLLDGNRLVVASGTNGANLAEYATEAETFSKVISYTSVSPNNPTWFKVIAKDGTVMEFGNSTSSKYMTDDGLNVILWRINKIIDINGNYIEFVYENLSRETRLLQIKYTGNTAAGLLPYNFIDFVYSIKSDANTVYEAGASIASRSLIDKIIIKHTNDAGTLETVKTYRLNYGFSNIHSMLKEVVEYGGDETAVSLNSTIFLYGDEASTTLNVMNTDALAGSFDYYAGDFNADGKSDLVAAARYYDNNAQSVLHTSYSLLSDFNSSGSTYMYSKTLPQGSSIGGITDAKFFNFLTGDYDGDGRDDVMQINAATVTYNCNFYRRKLSSLVINYTKSFNSQSGFTDYTPVTYSTPVDGTGASFQYDAFGKGNFFFPGDFDGDGNQDYILVTAKTQQTTTCGPNADPYYLLHSKAFITCPATGDINKEISNFGVGSNPHSPDFYAGTVNSADDVNVIDFNGDGKMELLVIKDQQTYILSVDKSSSAPGYTYGASVLLNTSLITKDTKYYPGDFNGDRKTDILVRNINGTWAILYSTGTTFISVAFTFNQTVGYSNGEVTDKVLTADFNGDGKTDILHWYNFFVAGVATTSKLSTYYSKGLTSAFFYEQYTYNKILGADIITGDFNGDGKNDFINRMGITSGAAEFIAIKQFGQEKLLKKITTGHNVTTEFNYKLLTDKTVYPYFYDRTVSLDASPNVFPFNYVQLPAYMLSSLIVPDGIGGNNTTTFTYQDAVMHRTAKGFLGFKKVTAVNSVSGFTSVTENEINTQFAVPYLFRQTTLLTAGGSQINQSTVTTSFTDLSTSAGKRYFQKTDKTLSTDNLKGNAVESVNTYDSYGNITTNTVKTGVLSGSTVTATETVTTTSTYITQNTPVPARPSSITTTNTRSGQAAVSATVNYTYATNGNMATKVDFAGLAKAVTNTFTYNSFGNPLTKTISATGLTSRAEANTFDTKGRFALTNIKASGTTIAQTTTYTYNTKWGKPLSTTSSDCLTTTFVYDAFGDLSQSTSPDGNQVTIYDTWNVGTHSLFSTLSVYTGGKPDTRIYIDKYGREWKKETATLYDGATTGTNLENFHTIITTYDSKGNVKTKTNSHFPLTETPRITTNNYDGYNRPLSVVTDVGTTTVSYTQAGSGNFQVSTTNMAGQVSSKTADPSGKIIIANDGGGQMNYVYDSWGNQKQVLHGSVSLITNTFDAYGRQTRLQDKDAGRTDYVYDAYGQLTSQTDNNGNNTAMTYDQLGRITARTGGEGTTTYTYFNDAVSGCSNNSISSITGFNGVNKQYTYDALRRLATEVTTISAVNYTNTYTYNTYSQLYSTTYPSGFIVYNIYDDNSYLIKVSGTPSAGPNYFVAGTVDGEGRYKTYTQVTGAVTTHTYNKDFPASVSAPGLQNLTYNFQQTTGNLLQRSDVQQSQTETFTYDNLNRLLTSTVNSVQQFGITYDGSVGSTTMGNIATKTDAGYYQYQTGKIHAIAYSMSTPPPGHSAVTPAPVPVIPGTQVITSYTPFLKTASISMGDLGILDFTYGPDYQRVKTVLTVGGNVTETKFFLGNYEKQIIGGVTREIHYINGGNGLCAMAVKESGVTTNWAVYKDYLGSILTLANNNGGEINLLRQNFDAWGRYRNYNNWNTYAPLGSLPSTVATWLYRGYTGHEMLPKFNLVNMNGRVYDPLYGRMLSPDNYVADPYGTQGYNRYTYANNNPLVYTDPDGNIVWLAVAAAFLVGGTISGLEADKNGGSFWGGFWKGGLISGAAALTGGAIAGALPGVGGSLLGGVGGGVVSGGLGAALNGGDIVQGIMFGAMTGFVGGAVGGYFGGGRGALIGGFASGALGTGLRGVV
jgi:RHS repeat-associated protein